MRRIFFGSVCLVSLLLCAATVALTVHGHRAWHSVIWRTDAAAAAEEAHTSPLSIWQEYRQCGRVPGQRAGRRVVKRDPFLFVAPVPAVTREYISIAVADGSVEYRRYPDATEPFS
jgi:hypothetical protein